MDNQLLARTHRAIRALESRKKAVVKEHAERIKRLEKAADQLVGSALDGSSLDGGALITVEPCLPPETLRLIDAPDEGL